jgi:hypothetical protein
MILERANCRAGPSFDVPRRYTHWAVWFATAMPDVPLVSWRRLTERTLA